MLSSVEHISRRSPVMDAIVLISLVAALGTLAGFTLLFW
jgi:hypothetical protein